MGAKVFYQGRTYVVLHEYNNGQVEIVKENGHYYDVQIAKKSELKVMSTNKVSKKL